MKKYFFTTLAFLSLTIVCFAQKNTEMAYQKGESIVNLGAGLGNPYWGSAFTNTLGVNPTISYEYGLSNKISIGAHVSYSGSSYNDGVYTTKYTGILVGPRASYHFGTSEKFDPYIGGTLGYVFVSVSVSDNTYGASGNAAASGIGYGAFLGARYFIGNNFGFHAEVGFTSFSFLTAGISLKF